MFTYTPTTGWNVVDAIKEGCRVAHLASIQVTVKFNDEDIVCTPDSDPLKISQEVLDRWDAEFKAFPFGYSTHSGWDWYFDDAIPTVS